MKKIYPLVLLGLAALHVACGSKNSADNPNQSPQDTVKADSVSIVDGKLSPEVLWSLGRVSGGAVSSDGQYVLYGVTYASVSANKTNRDLYITDLHTGKTTRLTNTPGSEWNETWRPDGKKVGYLAVDNGVVRLHEIGLDGNDRVVVKNSDNITNFRYGNTFSKILYTKEVSLLKPANKEHKDLNKTTGQVYDDLMARHWDHWNDHQFSHIFVADYDFKLNALLDSVDIMPNELWDSPLQPWGGIEEIAFSPDDRQIAYTCKKKTGTDYATSTNSEIYLYDLQTRRTQNISEGQMGYDKAPCFSPDGKYIAWTSMRRDGFEADQSRLLVYDRKAGTVRDYSTRFDQSAEHLVWSKDSRSIYFLSATKATYQIYALQTESGEIRPLTQGTHDYTSVDVANGYLVAGRMSMSQPTELYKVALNDGKAEALTSVNAASFEKLKLGRVEERWIPTSDKQKMLAWVIYPPDFDPTKKYPTLLYCQGGPQSAVSQFWSYRWNFQAMAAQGYIVVAPNRRGLPSFGQAWNDQISKDYGGQNIRDYLAAIDALAAEPYVDNTRLGAVGASYGGFSVFHLAGVHQGRFNSFIAHAGIFNFEAMYGSTEEIFFVDWDLGGPYWNKAPQNSYSASPHLMVANWNTPIMIVHGELDYRIPVTQALSAFSAARLRDIKARLLYFPDENHWILKPQNGMLWQREFFRWLDETLVKEPNRPNRYYQAAANNS